MFPFYDRNQVFRYKWISGIGTPGKGPTWLRKHQKVGWPTLFLKLLKVLEYWYMTWYLEGDKSKKLRDHNAFTATKGTRLLLEDGLPVPDVD